LSPAPATVGAAVRAAAARLAAAGHASARLDAEVLLAGLLRGDRAALIVRRDEPLETSVLARFDELIERRLRGEPVAYLRGEKEFFSLALTVDRRVLIPRPETEELVEVALGVLGQLAAAARASGQTRPVRLVDVGTGSGAIVVALSRECSRRWPGLELRASALDRSRDALDVARANAANHLPPRTVSFLRGHLGTALRSRSVDLVVANLPYLSDDELGVVSTEVAHEPVAALLGGGKDGGEILRELLTDAIRVLRPGGFAVSEIGWRQGEMVEAFARDLGFEEVRVLPDLAGNDRVLVARWRGEAASG
jgi:release factor glutamine methyltransferase